MSCDVVSFVSSVSVVTLVLTLPQIVHCVCSADHASLLSVVFLFFFRRNSCLGVLFTLVVCLFARGDRSKAHQRRWSHFVVSISSLSPLFFFLFFFCSVRFCFLLDSRLRRFSSWLRTDNYTTHTLNDLDGGKGMGKWDIETVQIHIQTIGTDEHESRSVPLYV